MSLSTSSPPAPGGQVLRWRQAFSARLAKPRLAWLDGRGLEGLEPLRAGQALDLVVSERALQHLVCEQGLPLEDEAALQAYARQLLSHYFGAAAQRWALAPWRAGEAAGASALHGLDLAALRQGLVQRGVALRGLRPAWAALLQRCLSQQPDWARAPQAALAWVEGDLLSWMRLEAGQLRLLQHRRLAGPRVEALMDLLAELRVDAPELPVLLAGYGLDAPRMPALPGVRQLGDLNAAAPRPDEFERVPPAGEAPIPRPDFAAPAEPPHRLAWALLACGLLVLGTAAWSAWSAHAELRTARERQAHLQAQLQRRPVAPPPAAAKAAARAQATLEQERLRSSVEVQALLRQPWGALLANVEQAGLVDPAAGQHIAWLGLDYSAGRRELRLNGLASDQAQALQLVERLSAAPGWGEVVLARFQTATEGAPGQRFDLSARLQPEALRPELAQVSRSRGGQP
ncbi:hypothetical protein QWZ02_01025 [Kinneretia asaccharophila]|uniref:Uncharacterized protein n=1 Tax=Roseateles asaccharophilus TaxID=582607 RepID=A0A4R6NBV7_9BURK|nr:hypothetical protein [Roseateles asaccharophilus]MDN3543023.1 hypothetical protein [Roseateles asaccharophilus]TDP13279.1 hypothetical protein DFR39_101754 [Roseateles asaccharophilus]